MVSDAKCIGHYGFDRFFSDLDYFLGNQNTSLFLNQNNKGEQFCRIARHGSLLK